MSLTITEPFWRPEPFTDTERQLLDAVIAAHAASVARNNHSTVTVINGAAGSGDYCKAIAAAILTIGGTHAPFAASYALLERPNPTEAARAILERGEKLPGFGGSFTDADGRDPLWIDVEKQIQHANPILHGHVEAITTLLRQRGKRLRANPSTFTAVAAITLHMPANVAPFIFIAGRLSAWSKLALAHL